MNLGIRSVLTLFPAILLNLFVSSNSFFMGSLGFFYIYMSSANSDSFTSSFRLWMPCIYFSYPIIPARTPKTMMNESGESGHP